MLYVDKVELSPFRRQEQCLRKLATNTGHWMSVGTLSTGYIAAYIQINLHRVSASGRLAVCPIGVAVASSATATHATQENCSDDHAPDNDRL